MYIYIEIHVCVYIYICMYIHISIYPIHVSPHWNPPWNPPLGLHWSTPWRPRNAAPAESTSSPGHAWSCCGPPPGAEASSPRHRSRDGHGMHGIYAVCVGVVVWEQYGENMVIMWEQYGKNTWYYGNN